MIEQFLSSLKELLHNVRIADGVDILLIALLIYCALLWFGETTSRRMLVGVTLLGLVYLAARMFEMHLTSLAFHTGFTVLLLLLIVVFQEDLRRMISRAASWITLSSRGKTAESSELEVVAESGFALAEQHIGALIVLPGKEPLERHLSGGVELNGAISRELLDSIFDPSSDGHDGAVILRGDLVERFGVHLPISTNVKAIHGHGTRHSAAVGLTESSDATVIVVSEERGEVSLATEGRLRRIDSQSNLLRALQDATISDGTTDSSSGWMRHITAHWRLKVLALSLAMIAWYVLAYDPSTVLRTFQVPIFYYNVPKNLELERPVSQAQLTLSGSEASFRFITEESLKFSVDLTGTPRGSHTVKLGAEHINLPANIEIESIEPDELWPYLREKPEQPRPLE